MHSDYNVTNLMYGAETTAELDIYRGEPKPRLEPLLLDTVMQGRPPVSDCRLLQIPSEILAKIVSFVAEDKKALQQLALVNSDCCGLSRACQFSDFTFDYNPNKLRLLLQLAEDSSEGRVGPGIKDCVRKFTFKPDPYHTRTVPSEAWQMFQRIPVMSMKRLVKSRNTLHRSSRGSKGLWSSVSTPCATSRPWFGVASSQ